MSQTDIERLRQAYEAFSRGDWNAAFAAAHPDLEFKTADRVISPSIVVFVLVRSRPKGSSAVVENRIGHLWTMREGKVARFEVFPEREKALEAAGLSEPLRKDASAG